MIVDLDAKWRKPKIRMHGELQKTKRDQYLPVTPDFAALLLETPAEDRTGAVFRPWLRRAESQRIDLVEANHRHRPRGERDIETPCRWNSEIRERERPSSGLRHAMGSSGPTDSANADDAA